MSGPFTIANDPDFQRKLSAIHWFHQIDLGNGVVTPGSENTARLLKRLRMPESLAGKTVIDIGAWDGYFSFDAERRGAARVLATDSFAWQKRSRAGFDFARQQLESQVEAREIDVLDLTPDAVGLWDVSLFLGVLYHMRHPLLALEKVASVTREMVVVETLVALLDVRVPAMAFYPDKFHKDATNWVGPNPAGVVAMLKVAGFARVEIVSGLRSVFFRLARAAYYGYKRRQPFWQFARTDRIVVHAWK